MNEGHRVGFSGKTYMLYTGTRSEQNLRFHKNLGYKPYEEKQIHSNLSLIDLKKEHGGGVPEDQGTVNATGTDGTIA